jgi:hypothetical protein
VFIFFSFVVEQLRLRKLNLVIRLIEFNYETELYGDSTLFFFADLIGLKRDEERVRLGGENKGELIESK